MKAVVIERYGTADVLEVKDVPVPKPGKGEVLVRVHAASLNDWDWSMIRGKPFANRVLYGLFRPRVRIPGCDVAGRVEAVGTGVEALQLGDEVYGDLCSSGFGAFAEFVCAPETSLARKPASMSFEQAAAIPQAGVLAVQGLEDVDGARADAAREAGGAREADRASEAGRARRKVLLNGAGGGVGTFALQIAKLRGAEVTVVDKGSKLDMLRAMGADHLIDYLEQDFTRSGERYDLILDVKTNRSLRAYTRALNPGGVYATVGGDLSRLLQVAAAGPVLRRWTGKHLRVVALKPNQALGRINDLFESGSLVPRIDRQYDLEEAAEAFRYFASGNHQGKIVLTIR